MQMKLVTREAGTAIPVTLPRLPISANISDQPFVSVVIPCRNEEKDIKRCLELILTNDYPQDRMERLVIDG